MNRDEVISELTMLIMQKISDYMIQRDYLKDKELQDRIEYFQKVYLYMMENLK